MKSTFATLALALSAAAIPHPLPKRDTAPTDTEILNYALTLEHLENAFYSGALAKFSQSDFTDAGLPDYARGRFEQVAAHEAAHVAFLSKALGSNATQPCAYNFPYSTPAEFVALSIALEGVGVSAYSGAAQFISNQDYLTAAAVVLSTEARHASWVAGAVDKIEPWSGALDTPLSLNNVYTLAAAFITSCPSSNPTLPLKAFPTLNVTLESHSPGAEGTVSYEGSSSSDGTQLAFFSGLSTYFAPISGGKFQLPANITGTAYAVVTNSSDQSAVTDSTTVAGPAIVQIHFDSNGNNI